MTNATSAVLQHYFATHSFSGQTRTMSVVAVVLLLVVMAEREILRATFPNSERRNFAAFAVVVIPMVVVFAAVIVSRFIHFS